MKARQRYKTLGPMFFQVSIHAPVKARLPVIVRIVIVNIVSIHAPVKARHSAEIDALIDKLVSIHAPVKARLFNEIVCRIKCGFQSTRP